MPTLEQSVVDYSSGSVATDLESFAKHAGRSTIKTDDVLLLARRNEGLESILKQKVDEIRLKNEQKSQEKKDTQRSS